MTKLVVDKKKSLKYRFEMKIIKQPDNGCWIWTACKDQKGYGFFTGKRAHRMSYEIYKGEIPEKMLVCHHCDNPSCVNPEHLWLGTVPDNNKDRDLKGRLVKNIGEKHPMCKISEKTALEIKERLLSGEPPRKIAKELNLKNSTVYNIKSGSCWKHI
jgi:HNH endonuclease